MVLERYISVLVVLGTLFMSSSCEKSEMPVTKPSKGTAQMARVDLGEFYTDQVFFDLAGSKSVMISKVSSWDLAFEANEEGFHIFMNGGKDLLLYNTHLREPSAVTNAHAYMVADQDWGFDSPSGLPDSTYVGDWRGKNHVYMVKFNEGGYKKIVFESVTDSNYVFSYGDLGSGNLTRFTISKNPLFNYAYFSFDKGGKQIYPEPPKDSWDIVFTRYRYIYYELENLRYVVTGALLNPHATSAIADSSTAFEHIQFNTATPFTAFDKRRDVIGFDWKGYNFTNGKYETNLSKCYIVLNRNNEMWKIRFIDFYDANGVKGSPSFEFQRIY